MVKLRRIRRIFELSPYTLLYKKLVKDNRLPYDALASTPCTYYSVFFILSATAAALNTSVILLMGLIVPFTLFSHRGPHLLVLIHPLCSLPPTLRYSSFWEHTVYSSHMLPPQPIFFLGSRQYEEEKTLKG